MNKAEVIDAVAEGAELTKADAGRAVDAVIAAITKALKKGDTVTVVGFGTFAVRQRAVAERALIARPIAEQGNVLVIFLGHHDSLAVLALEGVAGDAHLSAARGTVHCCGFPQSGQK